MDRAWQHVALGGSLLAVVVLVVGGDAGDLLYLGVGGVVLGAAVAALALGRVARPLPWVLLTAGMVCWLLADVVWTWYAVATDADPFPSAADVLYLAGYPGVAAGLAVLVRRRTGGAVQRASLLDAAVLTTGMGLVSWVFLVVPTADGGTNPLEKVVATAYPVLDVVLLSLSVRLLLTFGGGSTSFRALGGSMVVLLASDVLFALSELYGLSWGEPVSELGFLVSYTLLAVAVLHPTVGEVDRATPEPPTTLTRGRLAVLAGASLLAPGVQLASVTTGVDGQLVVTALASAALFGLVVLRLAGLAEHVQAQARELTTLVVTDPLTGAANRRGFTERVTALTARQGEPLVLAVLDIDHFKGFNDWHGHVAGDEMLRACVQGWAGQLRDRDHLARWGGEEFAVLLDRCGPDQALAVVDRLRWSVPPDLTCSAGIAAWDGSETPEELFARADAALYRAKAEGRDRSVMAPGVPAAVAAPAVRAAD